MREIEKKMEADSEMTRLQEELEKAKAEAFKAAEIGMKLLQTNEELREQIGKDGKVYEEQIEVISQFLCSLVLCWRFFHIQLFITRVFNKKYTR